MRKVEELGVSILGSLFKFCTGERLDRLVLKFGENECEKVDRLCELYCRYSDKLQALDSRYAAADAARAQHPRWLAASEEEKASLLEEVAEERYLERLDAGLYTMQLLAALLASIWVRLLGQPPKPNSIAAALPAPAPPAPPHTHSALHSAVIARECPTWRAATPH
jgi:hypothetical protein